MVFSFSAVPETLKARQSCAVCPAALCSCRWVMEMSKPCSYASEKKTRTCWALPTHLWQRGLRICRFVVIERKILCGSEFLWSCLTLSGSVTGACCTAHPQQSVSSAFTFGVNLLSQGGRLDAPTPMALCKGKKLPTFVWKRWNEFHPAVCFQHTWWWGALIESQSHYGWKRHHEHQI